MSWFTRFAIQAIYPSTEALPGVSETELRPFLKDLKANAPPLMRIGLMAATFVFMITPILTVYLPVPAFFLRGKLLERHASKLLSHRSYVLRQIVYLLKIGGRAVLGRAPRGPKAPRAASVAT